MLVMYLVRRAKQEELGKKETEKGKGSESKLWKGEKDMVNIKRENEGRDG